MLSLHTHDLGKKLRFARNFLGRRMVHVNLQLLYNCNFRCRICDFWKDDYRNKGRLSAAEVEVISSKLNTIGPQIISIGGGEPMLHPELVPIIRALGRHHFPVMITNGSLVTEALARQLWQAGMVEISVSIDYADPQMHDAQRGKPGAFAQGMAALKILHATRTRPEQRVNMISVIVEDNLDEVEPLIELSRDMGITYLVTLSSHSRGSKPSREPTNDLSHRLLDLKRRHRNFVALRGYLEKFSMAVNRTDPGRCHAGHNLCNIDCRGEVSFCIDQLDKTAGNILTDEMRDLEKRLLESHRANDCRECWTSCRGSIESVLYGRQRLLNVWDYYQMTRPVPLRGRF
jgi:MoaA/NifB/PqqE/SkfB family radical SAM enzyme